MTISQLAKPEKKAFSPEWVKKWKELMESNDSEHDKIIRFDTYVDVMGGVENMDANFISKQRVRESLDETMKEAIEYYPSFHKHINGALKEVIKRLGL